MDSTKVDTPASSGTIKVLIRKLDKVETTVFCTGTGG